MAGEPIRDVPIVEAALRRFKYGVCPVFSLGGLDVPVELWPPPPSTSNLPYPACSFLIPRVPFSDGYDVPTAFLVLSETPSEAIKEECRPLLEDGEEFLVESHVFVDLGGWMELIPFYYFTVRHDDHVEVVCCKSTDAANQFGDTDAEVMESVRRQGEWAVQMAQIAVHLINMPGKHRARVAEGRVHRRLEKKWTKRPGLRITYKVLVLPDGTETDTTTVLSGELRHLPLHAVRGHYAHYGSENPLFGKLTGTFWKPAHLRGNPAVGVVEKDYDASNVGAGR